MSEEIKNALDVLSNAMKNDPEYAWTWHCNLAMMAVDAGAGHKEANERAASFMYGLFGVNTSENPCYRINISTAETPTKIDPDKTLFNEFQKVKT